MYKTIDINKEELTLMGVKFNDLATLENTANAIGSNMFEGFVPTKKRIELIRDYILGKISFVDFLNKAKDKEYVQLV